MAKVADRQIQTNEGRVLATTRVIDAPRELVFSAWTDPRALSAWWGPDGFTTTTTSFDFRPGGVWRFVMHGPDGRDYENRIVFDRIERPSRIEYRHDDGGESVEEVAFATTVTFEDLGARTRITLEAVFPTAEERERVVREYGADQGAVETLGRLAELAAKRALEPAQSAQPLKTVVFVRTFGAPQDLVWRAWTVPAQVAAWWGPHGFDNPLCELDVREGGKLRIGMRAPDGSVNHVTGVYREVVDGERLIFTAVVDIGGEIAESLVTVTLAERDGGTTLMVEASLLVLPPALSAALEGMDEGWAQSLERLGAALDATFPRAGRR